MKLTIKSAFVAGVISVSLSAVHADWATSTHSTTAYVGERVTVKQRCTGYTSQNPRFELSSPWTVRSGNNTDLESVWATQYDKSVTISGNYSYVDSTVNAESSDYYHNTLTQRVHMYLTYNHISNVIN